MLSSSNKPSKTSVHTHHKVSEQEAEEAWTRARTIIEKHLSQLQMGDLMDTEVDALQDLYEPLNVLRHSQYCEAFIRLFEHLLQTFTADMMRASVSTGQSWAMCVKSVYEPFNALRNICNQVQLYLGRDLDVVEYLEAVVEALLPATFQGDLTTIMIEYFKGSQDAFDLLQMTRAVGLGHFFDSLLLKAIDSALTDLMDPYRSVFDQQCFSAIFNLFECNVSPKIVQLLENQLTPKLLEDIKKRVYTAIGIMRIDAMFDIIVDYPDSEPAIVDLSCSISKCHELKSTLASRTIESVKKRLLRPAAKTDDILQFYISTISAISTLDERGHLVQAVTQHICDYLRTREDTVRSIIHRLFNDEELANDLRRPDLITVNEDLTDDEWEPTPKDLPLTAFHKKSDILSSLVNIYDSKDVFVKEFQVYLSTRLLEIENFDCEDEIGHVELLKTRFGDCLHSCEVMLRDMLDSKRINQAKDEMKVLVLSHLFWPAMKSSQFKMPENMAKYLNAFEKQFELLKRSRKLKWQHDQGVVDLTLTMNDGSYLDVSVSTLHAAIISLFETRDSCSYHEIADELDITTDVVKQKCAYWISVGILASTENGVMLNKTVNQSSNGAEQFDSMAVDDSAAADSDPMKNYWNYISAMLTNLGSLPVERIHMMLSMFVEAPNKFDKTIEELQTYLDSLAQQDQLEFVGGAYKLKAT